MEQGFQNSEEIDFQPRSQWSEISIKCEDNIKIFLER